MRSTELEIDKFSGLAAPKAVPRNSPMCSELLNMKIVANKIESVNIPFILNNALFGAEVWPFPQILQTNNFVFVTGKTWIGILDVQSLLITKTTTGLTAGGRWKFADYTGFVIFTNGEVSVNYSSHTDSFTLDTDVPPATGLLNYNGQCLALGITI